jgi:hypothetical protein
MQIDMNSWKVNASRTSGGMRRVGVREVDAERVRVVVNDIRPGSSRNSPNGAPARARALVPEVVVVATEIDSRRDVRRSR